MLKITLPSFDVNFLSVVEFDLTLDPRNPIPDRGGQIEPILDLIQNRVFVGFVHLGALLYYHIIQ